MELLRESLRKRDGFKKDIHTFEKESDIVKIISGRITIILKRIEIKLLKQNIANVKLSTEFINLSNFNESCK